MAIAFTTITHVIPSFFQMADNYYPTAFKTFNTLFFTVEFLDFVQKSPPWVIHGFVGVFCLFGFFFFIGLFSQLSCILLTMSSYYFYALNAFHVGTLSWDILLVTLFIMCMTNYHGDYFSVDALIVGDRNAYKKKRPFFQQRLLQFLLGFIFFYTALYKTTAQGNWLFDNPIYYIMNFPPSGTTKMFLFRDYLRTQETLCYVIGLTIVVAEFLMIFLLFWRKTRVSAIYLGFVFHVILILTLDVPATFFFLFPALFLLFINPQKIVNIIEKKRAINELTKRSQLIFDGNCQFCLASVERLKMMDLFNTVKLCDLHQMKEVDGVFENLTLTKKQAMSQMHLLDVNGKLYGGFDVFRHICFSLPMLWFVSWIIYFPGMGILGPIVYSWVAKNRYLFHGNKKCSDNSCFLH